MANRCLDPCGRNSGARDGCLTESFSDERGGEDVGEAVIGFVLPALCTATSARRRPSSPKTFRRLTMTLGAVPARY
jgi:hypothetical protein